MYKSIITSIMFFVTFLLCTVVHAQKTQIDSLEMKYIDAAREIMSASNNCALITLDDEGLPHARVMDPFIPEDDLTVWFGSNTNSKKVNQILKDQRVTLYYLDVDNSGYVTIHGIAHIVDDLSEKEKRWKDEWKMFYPNRPDGYILIKVIPQWMEIISYSRGIFGESITWQAPIVTFDSNH